MYTYLLNLQEEYKKYRNMEEELRTFLSKHMYGDIDNISFSDGMVIVDTAEYFKGNVYHETYYIPFGYFTDAETFVNNYMKFRN